MSIKFKKGDIIYLKDSVDPIWYQVVGIYSNRDNCAIEYYLDTGFGTKGIVQESMMELDISRTRKNKLRSFI